MLCCAIKPLCGWNAEEAASVCRERCGGQGYLSCNRFGSLIGFAHAGITAEGDNRVLFQKTAKELTAAAGTPAVRARLAAGRAPKSLTPAGCAASWGLPLPSPCLRVGRPTSYSVAALLLPMLPFAPPCLPPFLPRLSDLDALAAMFTAREGVLLGELTAAMAGARGGPAVFEEWMLRQSDRVQGTARAYAEREVLAAALRALPQVRAGGGETPP